MSDTNQPVRPTLDERRRAFRDGFLAILIIVSISFPIIISRAVDSIGSAIQNHFKEMVLPGGTKLVMADTSIASQGIQDVEASLRSVTDLLSDEPIIQNQVKDAMKVLASTGSSIQRVNDSNKEALIQAKVIVAAKGWMYLGLVSPDQEHNKWLQLSNDSHTVDRPKPDIKNGDQLHLIDDVYLHDDSNEPFNKDSRTGFRVKQKIVGVLQAGKTVTVDRDIEISPTAAGNNAAWAHIHSENM